MYFVSLEIRIQKFYLYDLRYSIHKKGCNSSHAGCDLCSMHSFPYKELNYLQVPDDIFINCLSKVYRQHKQHKQHKQLLRDTFPFLEQEWKSFVKDTTSFVDFVIVSTALSYFNINTIDLTLKWEVYKKCKINSADSRLAVNIIMFTCIQ